MLDPDLPGFTVILSVQGLEFPQEFNGIRPTVGFSILANPRNHNKLRLDLAQLPAHAEVRFCPAGPVAQHK